MRAFEYWRAIDKDTGDKVEMGVRDKLGGKSEEPGLASAEAIAEHEPAE